MSDHSEHAKPRGKLPAWAMSVGLHMAAMLAIVLTFQAIPKGAAVEADRDAGIVLVRTSPGEREYFNESESFSQAAEAAESTTASAAEMAAPDLAPELDLDGLLPSDSDQASIGSSLAEGLPGVEALDTRRRARGGLPDGRARTSVFGVEGEGSKFVYVFDRSGSMGDFQGRPMAAARKELIASLEDLQPVNQFQIIFYNQEFVLCDPLGQGPKMLFGRENEKAMAIEFVKHIAPAGGTRHLAPLMVALRMRPDIVFFLTDAALPEMSGDELEQVRRANLRVGAAIHTIEFGPGPPDGRDNFLKRLARQNDGRHAYVDVTKLAP